MTRRNAPPWAMALLLLVGTVIAYLPVWHAGFIWDDRSLLIDNRLIRDADELKNIWFSSKPVDYYPATSSLWWLEWRIWGDNPTGYHAVSVLLHAANAVLSWTLLAQLELPGAWLAAALFAVHPVNVESVAWIAEQKNLLAMAFYTVSLCGIAHWLVVSEDGPSRSRGEHSWRWYGLGLSAFTIAMLCKSAVAPMPFVLLGLVWWRRSKVTLADLLCSLPFFAIAVAVGAVSFWFQAHRAIGGDIVRSDGFWARLAGAGWAIWFYLYKILVPLDLRSIYPRWQIDEGEYGAYLPALLVACAFALFWRKRERWGKRPLFTFFYFVVMLSPVLGFLNIGFMKFSLVADHWQYFAIIGPIAFLAAAIEKGYGRLASAPRQAVAAAVGLMLVGLGALTSRQSEAYRDAGTFWRAVLAADESSWAGHNNLGAFLVEQGKSDEALPHFRKAVEVKPDYAYAQYNLGAALREKGQVTEAIAHLQTAVDIRPNYVEAHNGLARALDQQNDLSGAALHLEKSIEIDPDQAEAHNNLANVLRQMAQLPEAAVEYEKALDLHPDYAVAHFNLADVLRALGKTREAVAHYKSALKLRPNLTPALASLAWVLATNPDPSVRDGKQAVILAARAEQTLEHADPEILSTLAAAYAEVGRVPDAVATAERALHLPVARSKRLQKRIQAQLDSYEAGKPYYEALHQ